MKKLLKTLPEGWDERPLKNLCSFLRRGISPSYSDNNRGLLIINQDCIRWEKIDLSKVKFHQKPSNIPNDFYLKKYDILINSTGTGTIGRIYEWNSNAINAVADSHVTIVRIDDPDVSPNYVRYFLSSEAGQRYLEAVCYTGSTNQIELSKRYLSKLILPCAPYLEQIAIAGILSKLEDSIESVKQSIKAMERLKKSLMQNLLTGKIRPDGTLRSENEFYIDEKFGQVPKGWEGTIVKKVVKLKNGKGNTTSNLKATPDDEYNIPVYGGNGITGYFHTPLLNKATLIVGRVGEYCGNVFKTPRKSWVTDNAMLVDQFLIDKYDLDFFAHKFSTLNFSHFSDSTGQPKITQGGIGAIKFAYPISLGEQQDISKKISEVVSIMINKQTKIKSLKTLKKSLMQNLLTGKIRVDEKAINQML